MEPRPQAPGSASELLADRSPAGGKAASRSLIEWVRHEVLNTAWKIGLYVPPDRRFLESVVLPHYARQGNVRRVLFVGVKWYNANHRKQFAGTGKTFVTIDPDPRQASHGGDVHIVDAVERATDHVARESCDVVIVNGVFGHGVCEAEGVSRSLDACWAVLRSGGELVMGVNEEWPPPLDYAALADRASFRPTTMGAVAGHRQVVSTPLRERTHTFFFFAKP